MLLTENDPQKILGDEVSLAGGEGRASQSNLTIVDCFNEPGGTEEVANGLVQCIDIEDLSGIRSCVESCCPVSLATSATSPYPASLPGNMRSNSRSPLLALLPAVMLHSQTILLVDSLNTLEAFNGSSSSYRLLKSILASDKGESGTMKSLHGLDRQVVHPLP